MTLNAALCCGFLIACASCRNFPNLSIPKGEICFNSIEIDDLLICEDERLPENEREYSRFLGKNLRGERVEDVCTNSDDYFNLRKDYIDTKRKYLACKRNPKACQ